MKNIFKKVLLTLLIVAQATLVVFNTNKVSATNDVAIAQFSLPFGKINTGTVYLHYGIYDKNNQFDDFNIEKHVDSKGNVTYTSNLHTTLRREISMIEKLTDNFTQYYDSEGNYLHSVKYINDNTNELIKIDKILYDLIDYSLEIKNNTFGYFDISIGNIVTAWKELINDIDFDLKNNIKIDNNLFNERVRQITEIPIVEDGIKLEIIDNEYYIKIEDGVKIDLGGIAKGYAIDYITKFLTDRNIKYFKINGAGSSLSYGESIINDGFNEIGISNPYGSLLGGPLIGSIKIKNTSISTSGDTNQNVYYNKRYYHHIISPISKMPEVNYRALTIVNDKGALADALTTAIFSMNDKVLNDFLKTDWAIENNVNEFIGFKSNKEIVNKFTDVIFIPAEGETDMQKTLRDWIIISVIVIIAGLGVYMFTKSLNNTNYRYAVIKYQGNEILRVDFEDKIISNIKDQPLAEGYPKIDYEKGTITLLGDYEISGVRQELVIEYDFQAKSIKITKEESPNNICSKQKVKKGMPIICLPNNIRIDFIGQGSDTSEII